MRRLLALLLVFALVLLPGCRHRALPTPEYTLNPDGTVDRLRWGMTYTQAARVVKQIAQDHPDARWGWYEPTGTELTVRLPDGRFLGTYTCAFELHFRRFSAEGKGSHLRLADIRIVMGPYDGVELEDMAARAETALTGLEPVKDCAWASPETLGQRVGREALEALWPGYLEGFIQRRYDSPLVAADLTMGQYQWKTIVFDGYYAALAEVLEK